MLLERTPESLHLSMHIYAIVLLTCSILSFLLCLLMMQAFLGNLQPPTQIRGYLSCRVPVSPIFPMRPTNSSTSLPVRPASTSLSSPACLWQLSAHDGQGPHKPVQLSAARLIYLVYVFRNYNSKGWSVVTTLRRLRKITLRRKWNYMIHQWYSPSLGQGIYVAAHSKHSSVNQSLVKTCQIICTGQPGNGQRCHKGHDRKLFLWSS